jgi:hypothetical protein
VQDVERGVLCGIKTLPGAPTIGMASRFYADGDKYKTAADVIRMLAEMSARTAACSFWRCIWRRSAIRISRRSRKMPSPEIIYVEIT